MFPISVGQTVFLTPTGNAALHWDGKPIAAEITMIGRKYFYVQRVGGGYLYGYREAAFLKDSYICRDGNNNYGYNIYESLQAFEQETDKNLKLDQIRSLSWSKLRQDLPYEAVLEIHTILSKYLDLGEE